MQGRRHEDIVACPLLPHTGQAELDKSCREGLFCACALSDLHNRVVQRGIVGRNCFAHMHCLTRITGLCREEQQLSLVPGNKPCDPCTLVSSCSSAGAACSDLIYFDAPCSLTICTRAPCGGAGAACRVLHHMKCTSWSQ
eukprot:scaffold23959_cov19-Tisochrysis_lutea.AAC.1